MTELKALFAKITKKENIQTDVGAWQDILGMIMSGSFGCS